MRIGGSLLGWGGGGSELQHYQKRDKPLRIKSTEKQNNLTVIIIIIIIIHYRKINCSVKIAESEFVTCLISSTGKCLYIYKKHFLTKFGRTNRKIQ
jgi:hypothetical protein